MTAVRVCGGPPVAVGLALRSYCFMKAVTMPSVDDPLPEKAMVLPAVSLSALIGRAGCFGANDADRRPLGISPKHAHNPRPDADLDAAGENGLQGFRAALGV